MTSATRDGIEIKRYAGAREVIAGSGGDLFVASEVTKGHGELGWSVDGAFAFCAYDDYYDADHWITITGTPEAATKLAVAVYAELGEKIRGFSIPRGTDVAAAFPVPAELDDTSDWEFMICDTPPPLSGPPVRAVKPDEQDEIARISAFLDVETPSASVLPGNPAIELWGVIEEDGEIAACGVLTRRPAGLPYLASIATAASRRGRGLGATVTAWLTRQAFEAGDELCTLAHYSFNAVAHRLYERLGYRTVHEFTSGPLRLNAKPEVC